MKIYAFRHQNGGYLNQDGGEPCCLCSKSLVSYDETDFPDAIEIVDESLLQREPAGS